MFMFNYSNIIDPLLRDLRNLITEMVDIKPNNKIIDVCCGTGEQVINYGKHGIAAIGIDNDINMINTALKNTAKESLRNISFQIADAAQIPFPACSFGGASITFGLHDKTRYTRDKVISEMKRIVQLNGAIIIADFRIPLPRNIWGLAARTVETLVGGEHYQGFKDYNNGGLDYIIKKHNFNILERIQIKSGLIDIVKISNTNNDNKFV